MPVRLSGWVLFRWPGHLVSLMLSYLGAADLARCCEACHRWQEAGMAPWMQAEALLVSYPSGHRRQLQKSGGGLCRLCLLPWCDGRTSGTPGGEDTDPGHPMPALD